MKDLSVDDIHRLFYDRYRSGDVIKCIETGRIHVLEHGVDILLFNRSKQILTIETPRNGNFVVYKEMIWAHVRAKTFPENLLDSEKKLQIRADLERANKLFWSAGYSSLFSELTTDQKEAVQLVVSEMIKPLKEGLDKLNKHIKMPKDLDEVLESGEKGTDLDKDSLRLSRKTDTVIGGQTMVLYDSNDGIQIAFYINPDYNDPSGVEFGDAKEFVEFMKLLKRFNVNDIDIGGVFRLNQADINEILQTDEIQNF
jgi:hypothetical protein